MGLRDAVKKMKKTRVSSGPKPMSVTVRRVRDFILAKYKLDNLSGAVKIKEMGMARRLAEQYPYLGFWDFLQMPYRIPSLTYLISENGQNEITRQYGVYRYAPSKKASTLKESGDFEQFRETLNPPRKIKSVDDFLKF